MTKIMIISCIVATACIFQIAEAGIFDKSLIDKPLAPLLGNPQDHISSMLKNIKEQGKEIQKQGKGFMQDLTNGLLTTQKEILTSTACIDVYNKGRETIEEITKIFDSCITNKTDPAVFEKLVDALNNLLANISKTGKNALKCLQNFFITPCMNDVKENVSKLTSLLENIVSATSEIIGMFPNIRKCYEKGIQQLSNHQVIGKLINDGKQCVQSILPF